MTHPSGVPRRPVVLIILDGFGVNPARTHNAVHEAHTPRFDHYFAHYAHTVLKASGRAVGLPEGQMGNSEVGHMTLGSGTVIRQDLVLINDAIDDGSFYQNTVLAAAIQRARNNGRPLHLIGLVSDGGVHSHLRHLMALLEFCRREQVQPRVHMITDGRDTAPQAALRYLPALQKGLAACGGSIDTLCGRYYAMDRDQRWDRTERAWRAVVLGEGKQHQQVEKAIEDSYDDGVHDEFIEPVIFPSHEPLTADDTMVFFNFRNDRPRQLTEALSQPDFTQFDRADFSPIPVTCLTQYDPEFALPVAFVSERPGVTLAQVISDAGLKQLHCAETEKYAHVTFFFNGGREAPLPGEERIMIPSPRVATYDLAPEMSAKGVADATIDAIESGEFAFIVVNFANGDMVGHTAVREAVIKAVETLDLEAGRVMDHAWDAGYSILMTADHGNCDEMIDPVSGAPHTQHTVYPVPCLVVDPDKWRLSINAGLSSVSPTILDLMGIEKPRSMTGESLLHSPFKELELSV